MKISFILLTVIIFLSGCSHKMTYTNFEKGEVLTGHYVEMTKDVEVTMSNGEVLKGKYSNIYNSSFKVPLFVKTVF